MTFIVTFISLIIERFFDWSHLRGWQWFMSFAQAIKQRFAHLSSYYLLAASVLPIFLLTILVNYLISGVLYGFISLLFQLVIFIYCLGPKNLWADGFACINALVQGDPQLAADKLKSSFGINKGKKSYTQSLHHHLLSNIFIESNRRVFAIVFWFFILGPAGAVLYRLLEVLAAETPQQDIDPQIASARAAESVLDWLPVRILTFIFALGGHFVQVLAAWRKEAPHGLSSNESMLTECGYAALGFEVNGTIPEDGSAERSAISLLDRTFIIVLVIVAVLSILGLG